MSLLLVRMSAAAIARFIPSAPNATAPVPLQGGPAKAATLGRINAKTA